MTFLVKKNYKGYRLLACDGSDLGIFHNPKDTDTYYKARTAGKGYNQLHLNVLYDLCENRYTDILIQSMCKENESQAMTQMVDLCQGQKKTIFIADRGYETYNIFAHIQIYQINHTIAIHICRYFLRNDIAPPAVEILTICLFVVGENNIYQCAHEKADTDNIMYIHAC